MSQGRGGAVSDRAVNRFVVVACAVAALAASLAGAPQTQVFRSTAEMVPLFVTVTDKAGRLAPNLVRDDFQIFDNGKLQPLTLFDDSPQPIRLIVLIDMSGSMAGNLTLLRRACLELITHLAPGDLARIGTFGQEIVIRPTFTADADELIASLPSSTPPSGPTPLWRAVDQAMTEFAAAPPGRRVVLVLSDGKDSGFQLGQKFFTVTQIRDRAQQDDVMIYGVGVRSSSGPIQPGRLGEAITATWPDPQLGTLALDTGGGYFELRGRDDLAATFARVADELHRQYLLGFAPPARDGKVHKVEVRMRGDGLKPRARKTYVAPK